MSTILTKKKTWRAATILLLAVAMLGPWAYDLIHVPAEFTCDRPNVRLQGDFCGIPMSLPMGITMFFGPYGLSGATPESLTFSLLLAQFSIWLLFPLLFTIPIWTTLALVLRKGSRRWQFLNLVVCTLAATFGVLFLIGQSSRPYSTPWGLLLYTVVLIVFVILELLTLFDHTRPEPVGGLETG